MLNRTIDVSKKGAGYKAADCVENGMVIGLGTGSTVLFTMERLKKRIRSGLSVRGVPTWFQTEQRARQYGIPLTTLDEHPALDLAIDGADQVDPALRLIKGRGAALTREKIVAGVAKEFIVVVDSSKMTPVLDIPVPVEVISFAVRPVMAELERMGGSPEIRQGTKKDGPVITDNGNFVVDCIFGPIKNPHDLEQALSCIPGIVGNGLFTQFTEKTTVIVGDKKGCRTIRSADIIT